MQHRDLLSRLGLELPADGAGLSVRSTVSPWPP